MEFILPLLIISSALICSTESFFFNQLFKSRGGQASRATNLPLELPEGFPANYPAQAISQLILENEAFYKSVFDDEELPFTESRFLNPEDVDLCEVTYTVEIPATLPRASDGKQMTIAQDFTKKIQQKIVHVHCKSVGECNFQGFPQIYESYCKQQHTERKLYIFINGTIATEVFRTPSCCTCHLRRKPAK